MPPQIADNEGWPFRLLSRVPYKPDSFADWREGVLAEAARIERELAAIRKEAA
jgi:hypothetical protein